jgi:hypothetical protein
MDAESPASEPDLATESPEPYPVPGTWAAEPADKAGQLTLF